MSTKRHRDATTGAFTTAEDAAARPAETVAETVRRDDVRAAALALVRKLRGVHEHPACAAELAALEAALGADADAGGLRGRDYGDETDA